MAYIKQKPYIIIVGAITVQVADTKDIACFLALCFVYGYYCVWICNVMSLIMDQITGLELRIGDGL